MNTNLKSKKIYQIQSIIWKIFGTLLFVTAITGIKNIDRYVPMWLYISLGIALIALIATYLYNFIKK